jgi:membrane protein YdbS with pleckstrin-like domain
MKLEVMDKLAALITAAFGLVAALAWNGAIRAIFERIFGEADNIPALVVYAVIVTLIAVFMTIWIARAVKRAKKENGNGEDS